MEIVSARADGHDDFFERRVAGALADAVDGGFHLACAILNACECVGDGESKIVVGMDTDRRAANVRDFGPDAVDERAVLFGDSVAGGVGNINHRGAGVDDGFEHFVEERGIGAAGVLGVELDVVDEGLRELDRVDGHFQDGRALFGEGAAVALVAKLAHHVNVGCTDAGVNARALRFREGFATSGDVVGDGARETADGRPVDLLRDLADGLEVVGRGCGIAGFDHVDLEQGELAGDGEFLFAAEARSGRLFTVSEGGVENRNFVGRHVWMPPSIFASI